MPKHYRITTTVGGEVMKTVERRQKPAAFQAYQGAVYDAIRSRAGLDTVWGRNKMAQSESVAENVSKFAIQIQDVTVRFERIVS